MDNTKLDVTKFGEDAIEQIENMNFTDEDKAKLEEAFESDVTDEEYFDLAFELAEKNGLNFK